MNSKIFFLVILVLVITGLGIYGYFRAIPGVENQTENHSRIEIAPQSFDFGEIEYGDVAKYTFKVKNSGDEILEIKKVATSCACTTAKISQEKILPKQEAELKVIYNTGVMSGPHAKGRQERIIYVKSNDPISPQVEVMITAYVNPR